MVSNTKLTKKQLAQKLNVSVSSLYYVHKKPTEDLRVKSLIEEVLFHNPSYGHRRIALALKLNKKRILRVMKKYSIKPFRRRTKRLIKQNDLNKPKTKYQNLIKSPDAKVDKPNFVWVTDFTYIKYKSRFIYLATAEDLFTREIVGINISRFHNKQLVIGALCDALLDYPPPHIIHSDQGSEYDSNAYYTFVEQLNIKVSMSNKASPWENGYKESFYSNFKLELGDVDRFDDMGELIETIYQQIYYHNNKRIHTSLKTTPAKYRESFYEKMGT